MSEQQIATVAEGRELVEKFRKEALDVFWEMAGKHGKELTDLQDQHNWLLKQKREVESQIKSIEKKEVSHVEIT